jgi:uncharacterized membrane protein HdeD (DUF308 family)
MGMRYGWLLVVRGVAAVVFGVLALVWPGVTVLALALLFGAYALVDGVGMIIGSFRRSGPRQQRIAHLIAGLVGLAAGVLTLVWPGITALVLVVMVGVWAIATGALDLWSAVSPYPPTSPKAPRRRGHWLLAAIGALSVVAGVLILLRPDVGALAIAQVIGVYAIISGALMLAEGWRLRRVRAGRPVGRVAHAGSRTAP